MATWHSYGKLRMHTAHTIKSFRSQTKELGSQLRRYVNKVCSQYKTKRLPGEEAATYRRQAAKAGKAASAPQQSGPSTKGSKSRNDPNLKLFNLMTYKIHALGDYADHIERFGTTDCFTTQQVCPFPLGLPLPHRHHPLNRANLSIDGSRSSTSVQIRSGLSARLQNTNEWSTTTASTSTCSGKKQVVRRCLDLVSTRAPLKTPRHSSTTRSRVRTGPM